MDKNETILPYVLELKDLVRDLATETGAAKVHLVAHSLGSEFLLQALEELTGECKPPRKLFSEVVFAAPDVDALDFANRAPRVSSLSARTTVYSSSNDVALNWSAWANGSARAGQSIFASEVESIDTSHAGVSEFRHGDYSVSAIDDLRGIIWLSLPPSRRRTLVEKKSPSGVYWMCDPTILQPQELTASRQAMHLARHVGIGDAIGMISKLVSTPAMNSEERNLRNTQSAVLAELKRMSSE